MHAIYMHEAPILRRRTSMGAPGLLVTFASLAALSTPACKSLPDIDDLKKVRLPEAGQSQAVSAPGPALPANPMETIARLEDARTDGDGLLEMLLAKGEDSTRERAAMALGRLPFPERGADVTTALCAALKDAAPSVRSAAAFSLGLRGDRAAASALLARWKDEDTLVRARIVEAASRIDDARLHEEVVLALEDPSIEVRKEAALGPLRWKKDEPRDLTANARDLTANARDLTIDGALAGVVIRALPGVSTARGARAAEDVEVAWRALFSLARRKSERGRAAFQVGLASSDVRARIFAAQGLSAIPFDASSAKALVSALADRDWRVVCEVARALGSHPDAESIGELAKRIDHPSPHVRRCVFEALGNFKGQEDAARGLLERARVDVSPNVRAAAIEAEGKLLGDAAAPHLELETMEKDPPIRAGAAAAAAHLSSKLAVPLLSRLSKDSNLRVAGIAVEGLAQHDTAESRERLYELLAGADNGLRLAAVEALKSKPRAEDLAHLRRCFATSQGEIASEIAAGVLDAVARIGAPSGSASGTAASEGSTNGSAKNASAETRDAAVDVLKRGLSHADPYVRKKARELIVKCFPDAELPRNDSLNGKPAALPPDDPNGWLGAGGRTPKVEIKTSKGTLVFELFPSEAPVHVYSFIELVKKKHYDGLIFHRVVPDFVIQGGDSRGDGNGGASWRGDALRSEFTPRKFVRGSLGMPRNDDPDSGGSQIFVTHRETPHLDGRYTLFGELREGFDVLDAIEVGDVILSARVISPSAESRR